LLQNVRIFTCRWCGQYFILNLPIPSNFNFDHFTMYINFYRELRRGLDAYLFSTGYRKTHEVTPEGVGPNFVRLRKKGNNSPGFSILIGTGSDERNFWVEKNDDLAGIMKYYEKVMVSNIT